MNLQALFGICQKNSTSQQMAVIQEPYVPHFPNHPEAWNGILVVAEAQNLSDRFAQYRSRLQKLSQSGNREALWDRLNQPLFGEGDAIGIGPWDDGTIKLTVACLRGLSTVDRVAVSNAVVWSAREGGASEHLRQELLESSVRFWDDLLGVLRPREILTFGATAKSVMRRTGFPKGRTVDLPGPFSRTLQIGFKMDASRLLQGLPEVADVLGPAREAFHIGNEHLAIHCACASISRTLDVTRAPK
jgi:hypothetical protein